MKIVLLGYGNLGSHIAETVLSNGYELVQIYSGRPKQLPEFISESCEFITDINLIIKQADIYIISVSDDVITEVANKMPRVNGLVLHTSGSTSIDVLSGFRSFGVFYPFQTFIKGRKVKMFELPILIEASDQESLYKLTKFAKSISDKVHLINSDKRLQTHLAAVFACNFTNFMNVIAEQILYDNDLSSDIIKPLIRETFNKLSDMPAKNAQTGPAIRGDIKTMEKHIEVLSEYPEMQKIYKEISAQITKYFNSNE